MNQCYCCKYRRDADHQAVDSRCIHPEPNKCEIVYVEKRKFKIQKIVKERKIFTDLNSSIFINDFFVWPTHFDPIMIEECKGFKPL